MGIPDPACKCLNWQETYAAGRVECGEFSEFGHKMEGRTDLSLQELDMLRKTKPGMAKEFCEDLIMRLNETFCLSVNNQALSMGAWCYVSSACEDLGGGKRITSPKVNVFGVPVMRDISAKICRERQDSFMRDMNPQEMAEFAERNKMSLAMLALLNYPKLSPAIPWSSFEVTWRANKVTELPAVVQDSIQARTPLVVYTGGDYHSHYKILWGGALIHLDKNDGRCPNTQHCFRMDEAELVPHAE